MGSGDGSVRFGVGPVLGLGAEEPMMGLGAVGLGAGPVLGLAARGLRWVLARWGLGAVGFGALVDEALGGGASCKCNSDRMNENKQVKCNKQATGNNT